MLLATEQLHIRASHYAERSFALTQVLDMRAGVDVVRAVQAGTRTPRALVWDAHNSSSVLAARSFVQQGWAVDWLGSSRSLWGRLPLWSTRTFVGEHGDPVLERIFNEHPVDALLLHGDDQVRWMLRRWRSLPASVHRHLPPAESLEIGLSKLRSMQQARERGIPVLDTIVCASRADVAAAGTQLGTRDEIVLKGEGGASGKTVLALRAGEIPSASQWHAVTSQSPTVMVQRRIRGPRCLVTVVYEHGTERAACVHEKLVAYPLAFGPSAFGVTRRIEILHEYAQSIFRALQWHGIADIEFRQDLADGRWYFIEINPRVCATLGIQERAGMDLAGAWARVCAGRGDLDPPERNYREGVRYAWSVRALAVLMRRPWRMPLWGMRCLLSADSDFAGLDPARRTQVLRLGLWTARHE